MVTCVTDGAAPAAPVADTDMRRLRWRCRRGMRELDEILARALDEGLPAAAEAERAAFEELLALGDPQLAGYLLGGQIPAAPHLAQLVLRIRSLCRSGRRVGAILGGAGQESC